MGLMNIGPEAWEEVQEELQKVLFKKGYNNYTACAILLSLAGRILEEKDADGAIKNEVIAVFLRRVGYAK